MLTVAVIVFSNVNLYVILTFIIWTVTVWHQLSLCVLSALTVLYLFGLSLCLLRWLSVCQLSLCMLCWLLLSLLSMCTGVYVMSTVIVFFDVNLYVMLTFYYINCNWVTSTITMLSVSSQCVMCMWTVTVFVILTVSMSIVTVYNVDYHWTVIVFVMLTVNYHCVCLSWLPLCLLCLLSLCLLCRLSLCLLCQLSLWLLCLLSVCYVNCHCFF